MKHWNQFNTAAEIMQADADEFFGFVAPQGVEFGFDITAFVERPGGARQAFRLWISRAWSSRRESAYR